MLLSWLKREIIAPTPRFLIPVVLDPSYCDKMTAMELCILIDPYKVDMAIVQQSAAFIQSNDDEIIWMENSLHTNGDSVVNAAFKELKSLP